MEQFVHHWHRSIHSSKKQNEKSPLLIWTSDFLLTVRKATKFLHFADGCAAAHTPGSRLFPGMTAFFSASCWDPFQSHKKMLWGMPTPAASITRNWPMGVHPWKHVVITSASSDAEIPFPLFPTCSVAFFFFFFTQGFPFLHSGNVQKVQEWQQQTIAQLPLPPQKPQNHDPALCVLPTEGSANLTVITQESLQVEMLATWLTSFTCAHH